MYIIIAALNFKMSSLDATKILYLYGYMAMYLGMEQLS